jgi:hypothetical protein
MVKFHLGVTYWESGRMPEAATLLEAALAHGLPAFESIEAKAVLTKVKNRLRDG